MRTKLGRAIVPLLAVLCALSFVATVNWRPAQFAVIAEIKTDAPAQLQLRYNRGRGLRQEGTLILKPSGEFVRVRFPIDVNSARDLRLVLFGFGRSLDLRSLTLKPLGGAARNLTAADLGPNVPNTTNTQIRQLGEIIHVEWNGTDPLVVHMPGVSRLQASRLASLLQWIFVIPLFCGAGGLVWALRPKATVRTVDLQSAEAPAGRASHLRTAII